MDKFLQLKSFVQIMESGSFSAAASQLRISTSTISRQIDALERELNVRLVNRNTRRLSLTEPGEAFYGRARSLIRDLNGAFSEARSFQDSVKGPLRVCLRVSIGTVVVVPALHSFLRKYPDVELHVALTDERIDLIENRIDVALWLGDIDSSELIVRRLAPSHRVACAAPNYLSHFGTPNTPEDFRRHNCLLLDASSHSDVWTFQNKNSTCDIKVSGSLKSDQSMVLYSAVLAGAGIMVGQDRMLRPAIEQGRLVRLLPDYTVIPGSPALDYSMVYASRRGQSKTVRAFIDFLVELFDY